MAQEEDAALLIEMLDIGGIDRILHSQPGLFLERFRPLIKRAIEGQEGRERKHARWSHARRLIRQAQERL
jgi:hypothetical protein